MKKTIRIIAAMIAIMMSVMVFAGCGGSANSSKKEDSKDKIVGVWKIFAMESKGETVDKDALSLFGLDDFMEFDFKNNGSVTASLYGVEKSSTWTMKDDNTVVIKGEEVDTELTYEDGKLLLIDGDTKDIFEKQ